MTYRVEYETVRDAWAMIAEQHAVLRNGIGEPFIVRWGRVGKQP